MGNTTAELVGRLNLRVANPALGIGTFHLQDKASELDALINDDVMYFDIEIEKLNDKIAIIKAYYENNVLMVIMVANKIVNISLSKEIVIKD